MSFRRKTYEEVVDILVTSLRGGKTGEVHPFPAPEGGMRLDCDGPVQVQSVYGMRNGQPWRFIEYSNGAKSSAGGKGDFVVHSESRTIVWRALEEGADLPDEGTAVEVNYFSGNPTSPLNRVDIGSVARTLLESIGMGMAQLYAQLEEVYKAGFIDTASGLSLDNVVALLGIERVPAGYPGGEVEFRRAPNIKGSITIPELTRIIVNDGTIEYLTLDSAVLYEGQDAVKVKVRDVEAGNDPVEAGALSVLPLPIAGIASVSNPQATSVSRPAETDEQLRTRAKSCLIGSERATLGALKEAVVRQGIRANIVEDYMTGTVQVTVMEDISPEQASRLEKALDEARPAGIQVLPLSVTVPSKVTLDIELTSASGLLPKDIRGIQEEFRVKLAEYWSGLEPGENPKINQIVALALKISGVQDAAILRATVDPAIPGAGGRELVLETGRIRTDGEAYSLGTVNITDPSDPALLSLSLTYSDDQDAPDQATVRADLLSAIASMNEGAKSETAGKSLSFEKLLTTISLPSVATSPIRWEYIQAAADAYQDENSIRSVSAVFGISRSGGIISVLKKRGDAFETLQHERLSLSGVSVVKVEEP